MTYSLNSNNDNHHHTSKCDFVRKNRNTLKVNFPDNQTCTKAIKVKEQYRHMIMQNTALMLLAGCVSNAATFTI